MSDPGQVDDFEDYAVIRAALRPIADNGSVDSGYGLGGFDYALTLNGRRYKIRAELMHVAPK